MGGEAHPGKRDRDGNGSGDVSRDTNECTATQARVREREGDETHGVSRSLNKTTCFLNLWSAHPPVLQARPADAAHAVMLIGRRARAHRGAATRAAVDRRALGTPHARPRLAVWALTPAANGRSARRTASERSDDGSAGSAYVGHAGQKGFKPHDSLGLASKQRGVGICSLARRRRRAFTAPHFTA